MIKKIIIKNFKSIKNLILSLNEGVTVLTGMNNSGKTNVMEAINVLVNDEYFPSRVSESFYFDGINEEANKFEICAEVEFESLSNWVNNSSSGKVGVRSNNSKTITWYTKEDLSLRLIKKQLVVIKSLERENPKQYKEIVQFNEVDEFTGEALKLEFDGYSFLNLAYPGAGLGTDKSAKNSLLTYKTSWFGKLTDSVLTNDIKEKISIINEKILEDAEFKKLENEINKGFFGTEKNLIPSILGIKDASISYIPSNKNLRTSFNVKVDDGRNENIESKSTGTQFITVIELFLNYLSKFNKKGILSIDEIESTLHPSIAKKVVTISSKKVQQFIFTTHSKDLIKIVPFANIIKIYKNKNETYAQSFNNNQDKLYPLIYQWPEVFFNDFLIITEGKECSYIESLISNKLHFSKKAAELNAEVINCEGGQVRSLIKHLEKFDSNKKVICKFILDAEYLFKNINITKEIAKFNGANLNEINDIDNKNFNDQILFFEQFGIFIMKKHQNQKGGIENYYSSSIPQNIDKKEYPLFLAAKLLLNESIDDLIDSNEYVEKLQKIFFE